MSLRLVPVVIYSFQTTMNDERTGRTECFVLFWLIFLVGKFKSDDLVNHQSTQR